MYILKLAHDTRAAHSDVGHGGLRGQTGQLRLHLEHNLLQLPDLLLSVLLLLHWIRVQERLGQADDPSFIVLTETKFSKGDVLADGILLGSQRVQAAVLQFERLCVRIQAHVHPLARGGQHFDVTFDLGQLLHMCVKFLQGS